MSEAHTASLLILNRLISGYLPACMKGSKLETQFPGVGVDAHCLLQSQHLRLCSAASPLSYYHHSERSVSKLLLLWGSPPHSLLLEPRNSLSGMLLFGNIIFSDLFTDLPAIEKSDLLSSGPSKNARFTGKREISVLIQLFQSFLTSCCGDSA